MSFKNSNRLNSFSTKPTKNSSTSTYKEKAKKTRLNYCSKLSISKKSRFLPKY